jgi:Flp pilus assembly pilin Flp
VCEKRSAKSYATLLWFEESGQDLTEYALLLVLIALLSISAMVGLATVLNSVWANAASNLTSST